MLEAFTLTSRGKQMACLADYRDEAIKGQSVVLYKHGFMGNKITPHRMVVNLAHRLTEEGVTVVRFDCPGAGDSEGDCAYTTIPGEMEDTLVVTDWIRSVLKPKKFILLGYSMGGCVAALLARKINPDGLLLWSPVAEPYDNFRHLLGEERFARGLRGEDVDFGGDRVGKEFFTGLDDPRISGLTTVGDYAGPVRIIHGSGDTDVLPKNSEAYQRVCTDVKRHVVPGATHGYDSIPHQEELFAYSQQYIKEIWKL